MRCERAWSVFEAAASRCEAAELGVRRLETTTADWSQGQSIGTVARIDFECCLRVISDGQVGTAIRHGADDWPGLWDGVVDQAIDAARTGPRGTAELFAGPADPAGRASDRPPVSAEHLGNRLCSSLTVRPDGFDVTASVETGASTILTSRGASIDSSTIRYRCEGRLRAGTETWYGSWQGGTPDHGGGPEVVARRLMSIVAEGSPADPAGIEVVVLRPSALGRLMEMLVPAFDGSRVADGLSPMVRWLGLKAMDTRITIAVDRTAQGGPWTSAVDDQGVPTRTLPIVDQGVITGFYGTLTEAAVMDTVTPGFGTRPVKGHTIPHPGHVLVSAGELDEATLVSQADCLLVSEMDGKIRETGDFYVAVLKGEVFRGGASAGPAPPVFLAGNTYQVLNQLVGISDAVAWVDGHMRLPSIAAAGIGILTC